MALDLSPRGLVLFAIGVFFIAILIPIALGEIFNVDTSSWGAAGRLWIIVGLAIVASVVLHFVPAGKKGGAT